MTVIAGCADGRTVWMGADSQATGDDDRKWRDRKLSRIAVGRTGEAMIGAAGDSRLSPLVRKICAPFDPNPHDDADCDGWAQAIAEAFTSLAVETVPPITGENGCVEGYVLLGYAGRLWMLTTSIAVPIPDEFTAIGSGGDYALGALAALHAQGSKLGWPAVHTAVAAACRFSAGCSGPIDVQTVNWPGD